MSHSQIQNKKLSAIIYCRVSSDRQAKEGHGLDSQEHRCREYAASKGYQVETVFKDSFTGGGDFMKRPAMSALLEYLDSHPHQDYVVVFDDLSRFARDVAAHVRLRQEFDNRRAQVECPNFTFEDTPEGEMVEMIMAAQNQYHRKSNRRQVVQKMKARLEKGYWPFFPPPGYIQVNDPTHGKLLTPKKTAIIIKEVYEGFAAGRFKNQSEVREYLQSMLMNNGKPVYLEYVKRLLSRSIYAGFIEYPEWQVARRLGHHEPIISVEVLEKVQQRLKGRTFKCRTNRDDFPLRGTLLCSKCGRLFTAGWTKGRTKHYPYYKCQNIWCKEKDVRKEKVESGFEELLVGLRPKPEAILLTEAIVRDVWQKRKGDGLKIAEARTRHKEGLVREKNQLIEQITRVKNESVIRALEAKIENIDQTLSKLTEIEDSTEIDQKNYGTAVETVLGLLRDPVFTWQNGGIQGQRLITRLVFVENRSMTASSVMEPPICR
jgi:site-specific DNA recombinase